MSIFDTISFRIYKPNLKIIIPNDRSFNNVSFGISKSIKSLLFNFGNFKNNSSLMWKKIWYENANLISIQNLNI